MNRQSVMARKDAGNQIACTPQASVDRAPVSAPVANATINVPYTTSVRRATARFSTTLSYADSRKRIRLPVVATGR